MFHPKSIPHQECAVSPLCIAVPAEDGLVKLSLNSTGRNECSVGRRHRMVCRCCGGPRGCSQR
jgi:hypothetical protein